MLIDPREALSQWACPTRHGIAMLVLLISTVNHDPFLYDSRPYSLVQGLGREVDEKKTLQINASCCRINGHYKDCKTGGC